MHTAGKMYAGDEQFDEAKAKFKTVLTTILKGLRLLLKKLEIKLNADYIEPEAFRTLIRYGLN
jgi:hypothetical protein